MNLELHNSVRQFQAQNREKPSRRFPKEKSFEPSSNLIYLFTSSSVLAYEFIGSTVAFFPMPV